MANTTVVIYEDNEALRSGLESLLLLSDSLEVIGVFSHCREAEKEIKQLKPQIILMDIDMPGMTGIEGVKKIRSFDRNCFIIMLTVFDDNKNVFDAICAGASGYLLKKHISEKLLSAIEEVQEGGAPMSPAIAKMVIHSMQHSTPSQYNFNQRENEILQLLCKGNSYKMIAASIGLSFETIRSYIKNIYTKLEVHSATEAVSKAINERLI